ncbi:sulfur carrier protein ThiS [Arthrobacter crystallopoietes BAB-32]|uniref:Sulfur carrier protein ThiS n=1 Tax=Arthrobacter crystallopoietes BAB-32 TaxID=1246476 RepID=N1V576_9MICC|nr:MoaD/ThiS family protein [Arthrobacter crystallopoietes]EMY35169.1 sulfur carrier protein ThiS [Arthrobacter crystallopoietes BAB-32]
MIIRYFGAAQAATGTGEEALDLPNGSTLDELLRLLSDRHPAPAGPGAPALATVISRSSFLVNEIAARDTSMKLIDADTIDILPPFAGG